MVSTPLRLLERHSSVARRQFCAGIIFNLDRSGFSTRGVGRRIPYSSHGPASFAHDLCSRTDPARCASNAVLARLAAKPGANSYRPGVSLEPAPATRPSGHSTCVLLVRCDCGLSGMARSSGVYAWTAVGSVACDGARMFPDRWISVLVAGDSTLAQRFEAATLVDPPVPFSGNSAVRHALWVSGVLWPGAVPHLSFRATFHRFLRNGRSASCGCFDVDLHHLCLPCARCGTHAAVAGDANECASCSRIANSSATRGGRLTMASEPMRAGLDGVLRLSIYLPMVTIHQVLARP
jgi:hypothetical protein